MKKMTSKPRTTLTYEWDTKRGKTTSARVSGNLTAPSLIVHEGAIFEGNCAMQPEGVREDRKPATLRKEERIPIQANAQNQP